MLQNSSPTTRRLELISLLNKMPQGMTLKMLADHFGVDEKTIRRDLSDLKKADVKVTESVAAHGLKYWHIDETPCEMAQFNFEEAAALYLGCRFLMPLSNSFLWKSAQNGLQKIRQQLGDASACLLDKLLDTFRESTIGWSDYSQQPEIITALIQSCEEKRKAVIHYRSLTADEEQSYTIHPYAILMRGGTIYVVGFSEKRDEMRTWKLNRITAVECLKARFQKQKDFDLETHRQKGFGVFVLNDEPVQKIRIKVEAEMSRFLQEHRWHETQKFEPQPDGGVIVQFEVVPSYELRNWILKLGRSAEVLEPQSLRTEIETEIMAMLRRYQL